MGALPERSWPISDGVVALRRFTEQDVTEVTRACQDPEIARWTAGIPSPYEEHHAQWWIAPYDSLVNVGAPAEAFTLQEWLDQTIIRYRLAFPLIFLQTRTSGLPWNPIYIA